MKTRTKITKESDYIEALSEVIASYKICPGTPQYKERELLLILIKNYEEENINHFPEDDRK